MGSRSHLCPFTRGPPASFYFFLLSEKTGWSIRDLRSCKVEPSVTLFLGKELANCRIFLGALPCTGTK